MTYLNSAYTIVHFHSSRLLYFCAYLSKNAFFYFCDFSL